MPTLPALWTSAWQTPPAASACCIHSSAAGSSFALLGSDRLPGACWQSGAPLGALSCHVPAAWLCIASLPEAFDMPCRIAGGRSRLMPGTGTGRLAQLSSRGSFPPQMMLQEGCRLCIHPHPATDRVHPGSRGRLGGRLHWVRARKELGNPLFGSGSGCMHLLLARGKLRSYMCGWGRAL